MTPAGAGRSVHACAWRGPCLAGLRNISQQSNAI